jgi:hypothetical protein
MKKHLRLLILLLAIFITGLTTPVFADDPGLPPPPPQHAMNGNQASPGGTGCPIDRQDGIMIAIVVTLAYAGFVLYRRGKLGKNTRGKTE